MWKVPLFDLTFDKREAEAAQKVISSGWLTMGEVTQEFEERFAEFVSVKHAIAVSSGTAALHMANRALGIGPEDEVICPSLTFVAAANSIVYVGAQPVFADVESLEEFSVSPKDIESKITGRTRAIQVLHYAGYPCDMDRILEVARRHGLPVVEDCAHAPGAEYQGRKCGSIGDLGCFSFFPNKNMTTGEGGMVTTNHDELARKIRLMRSHGMTSFTLDRHKGHAFSYDVVELGYNYRLDEMRSAIGLVQLEKLADNNRMRQRIQSWYRERLSAIPGVRIPYAHPVGTSAHHIFPVLLDPTVGREDFMRAMKERGIQTSIHYPPIHLFRFYRQTFGLGENHLPITEEIARRQVTLPLYPSMSEADVDYVGGAVAALLKEQRRP